MQSKLYLYGIVNTPYIENINAPGVTNSTPYLAAFKDMGIIASKYEDEYLNASYENLRRHDEVIGELMENYCILPIAFKNILVCEDEIYKFISKKYDQIKLNFDKLSGKCEMGLKAAWNYEKVKQDINNAGGLQKSVYFSPDTKAKAYLQQKINAYGFQNKLLDKAETIKKIIIDELENITSIYKIKLLYSEKVVFSGAFLVNKPEKEEFIHAVTRLKSMCSDLHFLLSGPWAAYNFVELSREE